MELLQETTFIEQLVEDESQMEGLPSGCSKIMVWHLHVEAPDMSYPAGWTVEENLNATVAFL
jgi:galactosylgalactosylxylosylprotein 3-beta-glucuronosyltransferase 1